MGKGSWAGEPVACQRAVTYGRDGLQRGRQDPVNRIAGDKLDDFVAWARWLAVKVPRRAAMEAVRRLYWDTNRSLDHAMVLAGWPGPALRGWPRSFVPRSAVVRYGSLSALLVFQPFAALTSLRTDAPLTSMASYRSMFGGSLQVWFADHDIDRTVERLLPDFRLVKAVRASLFPEVDA